jgi:hypothetical protein
MPQRKGVIPVCGEVRAIVAVFRGWLVKEGYDEGSHYPNNLLRMVRLGADLHDPESVKETIGRADVKKGTKLQYVYAYDAFAKMLKIEWKPPSYSQEEIIPFVPEEEDLDCLIAACRSRQMATYLQCLKETFGDTGEVLRIEHEDVSGNIVTINHPVKGHLPRQIEVSDRLIAMLNSLPKRVNATSPIHRMVFCGVVMTEFARELRKCKRTRCCFRLSLGASGIGLERCWLY